MVKHSTTERAIQSVSLDSSKLTAPQAYERPLKSDLRKEDGGKFDIRGSKFDVPRQSTRNSLIVVKDDTGR